jgi:hypothetical protein
MNFNTDLFRAKVFHGLKNIQCHGDTLSPRYLEIAITESFGGTHVGDSAFYADGIVQSQQLSIKTRMLSPIILKTKSGRDFQSHPEKFLGPHINQKHNRYINGLEIVQRRQQLNLENDSTASPIDVGRETLAGFEKNIAESVARYNVVDTYEIICVHGYDRTNQNYIAGLFWKQHEPLNYSTISWARENHSVVGYVSDNGIMKKICERINGNAKREATCFKEYKDLTKYQCSVNIKVPLPDPWVFDLNALLAEIELKTTGNLTKMVECAII